MSVELLTDEEFAAYRTLLLADDPREFWRVDFPHLFATIDELRKERGELQARLDEIAISMRRGLDLYLAEKKETDDETTETTTPT